MFAETFSTISLTGTGIRLERVTILCVDPRAGRTSMRSAHVRRAGHDRGPELRYARHPVQSRRRGGLLVAGWKDTADWIHPIHARGTCVDIGYGCLLRRCCMPCGDGRVHCRETSGHGDRLCADTRRMERDGPVATPSVRKHAPQLAGDLPPAPEDVDDPRGSLAPPRARVRRRPARSFERDARSYRRRLPIRCAHRR